MRLGRRRERSSGHGDNQLHDRGPSGLTVALPPTLTAGRRDLSVTPYTNATTVQELIYSLYAEAMLAASLDVMLPPVSNSTPPASTNTTGTGRRRSLQEQRLGLPILRHVLADYDVFVLIEPLAQAIVESNTILLNNVLNVSDDRLPARCATFFIQIPRRPLYSLCCNPAASSPLLQRYRKTFILPAPRPCSRLSTASPTLTLPAFRSTPPPSCCWRQRWEKCRWAPSPTLPPRSAPPSVPAIFP